MKIAPTPRPPPRDTHPAPEPDLGPRCLPMPPLALPPAAALRQCPAAMAPRTAVLGPRVTADDGTPKAPVQRVHVHMCGSGVSAHDPSNGRKFGDAFMKHVPGVAQSKNHMVGGPGHWPGETSTEKVFGKGLVQSDRGQDARILQAVNHIGAAWLQGAREIVLTGFSRGGANAIEVARFIEMFGLLDGKNRSIEGTQGAAIKYLGLLDPVPVESLGYGVSKGGTARRLTEIKTTEAGTPAAAGHPRLRLKSKAVWYRHYEVPRNVQFVKSILAHAESRGVFDAYRVQVADPVATQVEGDVIPFAVHSQVGGTSREGTESIQAILAFDAILQGAKEAGVDFGELDNLSASERRAHVVQLFKTPRMSESSTTKLLIKMRPLMRSFHSCELGQIAHDFISQLASQSNVEVLAPVFKQFHLPPPYVTDPLRIPPHAYFAAIAGPERPARPVRLPRTGAIAPGAMLFPQILLLMAFVASVTRALRGRPARTPPTRVASPRPSTDTPS